MYRAIDESGFEKITKVTSSKEVWVILEVVYRGDNYVRKVWLQTLKGEFENLKMEDKEGVTEYITRVEKVTNELSGNEES